MEQYKIIDTLETYQEVSGRKVELDEVIVPSLELQSNTS